MKTEVKKYKKFSSEELSVFCEQIAMLLHGGVPLYDGIYMLYTELEDKKRKAVLGELYHLMKDNIQLHMALQQLSIFPEYMVHMVKIGECTGKLEEVMKGLATYYERENNVKLNVRNAITYPIVLLGMMSVIILIMSWKILPLFENMFLELDQTVSAKTKQMMMVGITAGNLIAVITTIIFILTIGIVILNKTLIGNKLLHTFYNKLKTFDKLSEEMAIGKFISGMALMISSGMDMQMALESTEEACEHNKVKAKITNCKDMMSKGLSLEEAINETKLITGMDSRMLHIASKTGSMDSTFAKLSDQYNNKVTNKLSRKSTIAETVLVVTLSMSVGAVLISVMLPLVTMISSIG